MELTIEEEILKAAKDSDLNGNIYGWMPNSTFSGEALLVSSNFLWSAQFLASFLTGGTRTDIDYEVSKLLSKLSQEEAQQVAKNVYDRAKNYIGVELKKKTGQETHFTLSEEDALVFRLEKFLQP